MIEIKHTGSFRKTEKFLKTMSKRDYTATLRKYGELGVAALAEATPKDSGITAASWSYELAKEDGYYTIYWKNSSRNDGANIAILLQYGHATGAGVYVKGVDYVNPAIKSVFDQMATELWNEVQSA